MYSVKSFWTKTCPLLQHVLNNILNQSHHLPFSNCNTLVLHKYYNCIQYYLELSLKVIKQRHITLQSMKWPHINMSSISPPDAGYAHQVLFQSILNFLLCPSPTPAKQTLKYCVHLRTTANKVSSLLVIYVYLCYFLY